MPHEQPTSEGLNSPSFNPVSINLVNQSQICIDHDLDESESNQCFELESVP